MFGDGVFSFASEPMGRGEVVEMAARVLELPCSLSGGEFGLSGRELRRILVLFSKVDCEDLGWLVLCTFGVDSYSAYRRSLVNLVFLSRRLRVLSSRKHFL
jgi:hypothetical protein